MKIIENLSKNIERIINRFFLNCDEKAIIEKNRKLVSAANDDRFPVRSILIQMPEDYQYVALFSLLIRTLSTVYNLKINWININCEYQRRGVLRRNRFFERKWTNLYLSLGGQVSLSHILYKKKQLNAYRSIAKKILETITTKEDLVELSYKEVHIGDLIYDTYLRYKPAPTLDLTDPFLIDVMASALHIFENTSTYLDKNIIDYLFTSYCTYIHHGIPVRMALKKKIKVYSMGSYLQILKEVKKEYPLHVREYSNYKNDFLGLANEIKEQSLLQAKEILSNRLSGIIDPATFYMKTSAYIQTEEKFLKPNGKPQIIFLLHCFFDSPHIYRTMIFPDFYEWIVQSLRSLDGMDYNLYIKKHPNAVNGNNEVIDKILSLFPNVTLLPPTANNAQLAKEGIDLAVTVYGTMIHEFYHLGVPILVAGDNPHSSYKFGTPVKDKVEYFEKLRNRISSIPNDSSKEDIFSFISMHSSIPDQIQNKADSSYLFRDTIQITDSNRLLNYLNEKTEKEIENFKSSIFKIIN